MSQQPNWITAEGSLGTVPEGEYYRVALVAVDPDFPNDPTQVTYSLIAGSLPDGVAVNRFGTIEGIPVSIADFKGVPQEVSENVESKFTIRATTESNRIKDRTFTLTVTGQDIPEWVTPAGLVGADFDGNEVNFQFEVTDDDPGDEVIIERVSGELPPGLTLSESGLLTGHIAPTLGVDSQYIGFDTDGAEFDEHPFSFGVSSINKNFQFTLQVTDGKDVNIRTFAIYVLSRDSMTADTTQYTADANFITCDTVSSRGPYLTNYEPDFGRVKHDNFFAFQLKGVDPDGGEVNYQMAGGSLPANLILDPVEGWISGYLPNVGLNELEYNFSIQVITTEFVPTPSQVYKYTFTTVGEVETDIIWTTPEDLGTIDNGSVSTFYVEAIHKNTILNYRLKSGEYSKLPQGLSLLPSGNIVGRTSFKTFSLDSNTTTFDADFETRLSVEDDETTFDRTFVFNVEAYSNDGFVSVTKEFVIHLNREYETPFNILYAKAMPPQNDRTLINNLLLDTNIMVPDLLYRSDDPNFGVAKNVIYSHAYGLAPASISEYFEAMNLNHYHKHVTLGEISTARALDNDGNIIYEVVYSNVIDNQVNPVGESVSKEIDLDVPAVHRGIAGSLNEEVDTVYPNSFDNMRNQVIEQIGQVSKVLPTWMLSKQEDGRILGFTPAWVIAYTKPGQSRLLAYRIENDFKDNLNKVDFTIDRFTLNYRLTKDWEICDESITSDTTEETGDTIEYTADNATGCDDKWSDSVITTFDRIDKIFDVTADNTDVTADSNRYINVDSVIDVDAGFDNQTSAYDEHGFDFVPPASEPRELTPYDNQTETVFDGGSTRFISPVDNYEATDKYDRYILFPQVEVFDPNPVI